MTALGADELATVRRFLLDAGEDVGETLTSTLITGGRSNLTYLLRDDATGAWVLRRPPMHGVIASAHDVAREYRVCAALQGTAVPVARTVGCETSGELLGAPFTVVEYVEGRTIRSRSDLAVLSAAELDRCLDTLVATLLALHNVDFAAVGLADFGRQTGYAERQVRRWSRQWREMGADDVRADQLLKALEAQLVDQRRCTIVHGDYRIDNTLLDTEDAGVVRAVVDWELSTLGDPVADVALMCVYRHAAVDDILELDAASASPRLPAAEDIRTRYERAAGTELAGWRFHLPLAYYKLAVIAEGIDYRHRQEHGTRTRAALAVPQLLEAGLEAAHG